MPISVVCDHCLGEFRVKDELAGKRVRCKSCAEPIRVPGGEEKTQPAARRRKPAMDELDDWGEPELELPRPRAKSANKKKKSHSASVELGPFMAKLAAYNIGPMLVKIVGGGFLLLYLLGFFSPAAAVLCYFLLRLGILLAVIGAILAVFVIAAREHVVAFLLCFIPFYYLWFVCTRWARTWNAVTVFLIAIIGGPTAVIAVALTYALAGINVDLQHHLAAGGRQVAYQQIPRSPPGGPAFFRPLQTPVSAPTVAASTGDPSALFPVSSIPVPQFKMELISAGNDEAGPIHQVRCESPDGTGPGARMTLRLRLPPGEHQPQTLPCILIAPAGSTLLTGMDLDGLSQTAETAPYVKEGYAVVEYTIDGATGGAPNTFAYLAFSKAYAGVVNGRNALEFVLAHVPQVNPNRIFTAGHSSAAVLSLLLAEHEPRIKGCIAYAPASDIEARLKPNLPADVERMLPGVFAFLKQSSPKTHVANLNCPVFLFHAQDDSNEPIATTRAFHASLQALGKQSTFVEVPTGDHYESMVQQGIPAGLRWLYQLPGN